MDLPKPDLRAAKKFFQVHHPVWGFILLLAILIGVGAGWQSIFAYRLMPRLLIGGVEVGRMTREQALVRVTERVKQLEERGLRYSFKDHQVVLWSTQGASSNLENTVSLFDFDPEESVNRAWTLGHEETWIVSWLHQARSLLIAVEVPLAVEVNTEVLASQLQKEFGKFTSPSKNARFVWRYQGGGGVTIVPSEIGQRFPWEHLLRQTAWNLQRGRAVDLTLSLEPEQPVWQIADLEPWRQEVSKLVLDEPVYVVLGEQKWLVGVTPLTTFFTVRVDRQGLDLDEEAVSNYLAKLNEVVIVPVREARFEIKDGRVVEFAPSQAGKEIDVGLTLLTWREALLKKHERNLPILMHDSAPIVTTANANTLGIRELIGVGKSQFAGSPKNRRHNIQVGASRLHGLLIAPGAEFSLLKALGPVDGAHGFLEELVIKGDRTIPEFGGGLCQIGTTTFRMALASGMPILERQNHSYRVTYYEPAGTDATIYNPKPDFRFENDTGHYVLIQTKIQGDEAIFEIWGTKDGRIVEQTKPVVYNFVNPPPTKLIETAELPPGKKKCTERAHVGASAKFTYTVIYPDGEKKEKEFRSYYKPWQEVCLVGVGALSIPAPVPNVTPTQAGIQNH